MAPKGSGKGSTAKPAKIADNKPQNTIQGKSAPEDSDLYAKNIPLQAALAELAAQNGKLEYLTSRITLQLLRIHFSPEHWSIVAEYYTEEAKKPDYVVEKIENNKLTPHIFVECKSKKGDSFNKAVHQLTEASQITADELSGNYSLWFIVTRNDKIGFYLYSNDRSNLEEDGIPNYNGAIPVNQLKFLQKKHNIKLGVSLPDWLDYKAKGKFPVEEEKKKGATFGHYLSIKDDAPRVRLLMDWIRDTDPIDLSEKEIPKRGYKKKPDLVEEEDLDQGYDQEEDFSSEFQKKLWLSPRKIGQKFLLGDIARFPSMSTAGEN
jgi:hypothetical protein